MRLSAILMVLLLLTLTAGAALAGPPLVGAYTSVDNGGPVYVGHYTEGWDAGGGATQAGTTLNAVSWNDPDQGTQWRYWCSTEVADGILWVDTVDPETGNGNRVYLKMFTGGYIWLSGSGPWANGDSEYTGVIDSYNETETVTYQNWVPIAAVTSVNATATFDGYDLCMAFYIGNGNRVGTTDLGDSKPIGYPDFLDDSCNPVRTLGAWWDFDDVTLTISGNCTTPVEDKTWGEVKAMYSK